MINKEILISRMEHCIGFDRRKPYTRHGRKFFKPYRNYYATREDELMEEAVKEGLLYKRKSKNYMYYSVTDKGREWLGNEIGVVIYEEEE